MNPGVFMLVNEFPPLVVGGAERQAERLARYVAQHGWSVTVLTRGAPGLAAEETRDGFQICRVPATGIGKIKTIRFVLGAVWTLWCQRKQYSIVHAHLAFGPALAGALVGRLLHKVVLVKFGNSGPFGDIQQSQRTWRGRLRLNVLRRWATAVVVLDSEMQAEVLKAGFSEKQVVRLNNGIDAHAFEPCSEKSLAKAALGFTDQCLLLYVGRLGAQKSLDTLLNALLRASAQVAHLHLLLVGDGPERTALEALVQQLGLSGKVTFAGPQADIHPYLDAADIFVLPSLSEGISNALLEAMSAGVGCIATTVGGTPEVLDQGNCGLLVDPAQIGPLAEAIVALADQPARARLLGLRARARILQVYDFSVIGQAYLALYGRLLDGEPKGAV